MRGIADRIDGEEPAVERLLDPEETAQRRMVDVDDAQVAAAEQPGDVGAEIDRHAAREHAAPLHADAERVAHTAVGAVGRHHVLRVDVVGLFGVAVADHRVHVVRVLLKRHQVGGEPQLGAELVGP